MVETLDTGELPHRLLGVWPHPDDEAYLSTGLMGRMTDADRDVTVLTMTSGEKGTADSADHGQEHFARQREQELRACLSEVGVDDLLLLGYRDGECEQVPDEQGIADIATVIGNVRPDAVVTFGPDGITGHPDHRVVSRWTTEAWRRLGSGELLYATVTDGFVDDHADMHAELGLFGEFGLDAPVSCSEDELALAVALSEAELDRKRRALASHASQTAGLASMMGEATYRDWWRTEYFRRPTAAEVDACRIDEWRAPADQPGPVVP